MTDEELAEWLLGEANYSCNICIRQNEKSSCYDYSCEECVAKWLKQEVSLLDRLSAEYDRKHPNGLKLTYSLDGEVQQTEQEGKENG
jgi:hypothetical protein